jgi:outer membrane receptor for ferrienterochelin and colicins
MKAHSARPLVSLALTTLALNFALPSAHAQPGPGEQASSPNQLDEVNVTARRDFENRFNSTGARVTIGRRDIEAIGANTIGDILRQTPGLQVTTTANGGLEIRMRGMGAENTRIMIDGVAVGTSNRNSQLPLDELPADLIERVEVIRAPTAEFQGAAGGTLNIVLRAASAKRETYIWLSDQYVWGRHAPQLFFSTTGPLGERKLGKPTEEDLKAASWTYFVSLTAGPRNLGSNTTRQASTSATPPGSAISTNYVDQLRLKNSLWTLIPRFNGRLGASDKVTLRGTFSTTKQDGTAESHGEGISSSNSSFSRDALTPWNYERNFYQLGVDWSHSFKDSKWDTTVQAERSRNLTESTSNTVITPTNPLGAGVGTSGSFEDIRHERALYLNSKWVRSIESNLLTFGGEFDRRTLEVESATILAGVTNPASVQATTTRKALWSQYELPLESIKTTLVFGLRAQDYAIESVANGTPLNYQNLFWQPSINSRTAINDTTQLRWNLAKISRNPRIWELSSSRLPNLNQNSPNSADFQGNPNLKPESTITLDLGVDKRMQIGGQYGLNVFLRSQTDVIARSLSLQSGRWLEQPDNVGNAMVWGIESDVRTNLKWAGLGPDWTLSANASLLQSRMRTGVAEGQRIPGQARYLANVNIAKPLRVSGGWYGGATLALVGASEFNTDNAPGVTVSGHQAAHTQLDLYIGSVFPALGFWRLNVFNVTNFSQDRNRTITDSNGIVYSESFSRKLTPRWFLTFGTRF